MPSEMALLGSIWPTFGLIKLAVILKVVIYFSIHSLSAQQTVLSSTVCFIGQNGTCHCINDNSKEVQCLLRDLNNTSCEHQARKSFKFFCEVMSQFDCRINYSVKWNCSDCLVSSINLMCPYFPTCMHPV